jgi:uncharacterized protein YjiS (DUF1127 family)
MSIIHVEAFLRQSAAPRRRVSNIFRRYWVAFQDRRNRRGLQIALCNLSDRELMDIGTTRGEIDYVASHRDVDPRGIRSFV